MSSWVILRFRWGITEQPASDLEVTESISSAAEMSPIEFDTDRMKFCVRYRLPFQLVDICLGNVSSALYGYCHLSLSLHMRASHRVKKKSERRAEKKDDFMRSFSNIRNRRVLESSLIIRFI